MSDLISREDLIDRLTSGIIRLKGIYGDLGGAVSGVREMVKMMPSAEPERKKGKWIDGLQYINSHWWVCSVCHVSAPENHTGYNFCPHCGADMRAK